MFITDCIHEKNIFRHKLNMVRVYGEMLITLKESAQSRTTAKHHRFERIRKKIGVSS